MSHTTNPGETQAAETSVIKIFNLLEKQIGKINKYPLNTRNLNIQRDAYKRLAQHSEDGDRDYEFFANIIYGRKENDSALTFGAEFASHFMLLHIESIGDLTFPYEALGDSNEEIAQNIVTALVMLANGQISCLLTAYDGVLCTSETLYRSTPSGSPITIAIEGNFPKKASEDIDHYQSRELKNDFNIKPVEMPVRFFLGARKDDKTPKRLNRYFQGNYLNPLTAKHLKTINSRLQNEERLSGMGAKNDNDLNAIIWRSHMYWLMLAIFVPAAFIATHNMNAAIVLLAVASAIFFAMVLMGFYLPAIEKLRRTRPSHPLVKFETIGKKKAK